MDRGRAARACPRRGARLGEPGSRGRAHVTTLAGPAGCGLALLLPLAAGDPAAGAALAPPRSSEEAPFVRPRFAVSVARDVVYASAAVGRTGTFEKLLRLDLYEPAGGGAPSQRPGFVVVHGGSLGRADKADANVAELCREMAARGYLCASINYRMGADDPPLPGATLLDRVLSAGAQDAGRALGWLRDQASRLGLDGARVAAGGSSSGAEIVLRLAYGERRLDVPIAAVLSWSGGLDGKEHQMDAGEPALFIVHGAEDASVSVQEARALAGRACRVGLPHEVFVCAGLGHTVPLDRRPAGRSLYHHLAEFLYHRMDLANLGRQPGADPPARASARRDAASIACPR